MQGMSRFTASALLVVLLAFAGVANAQTPAPIRSDPTASVTGRAPTISEIVIQGTPSGPNGTYAVGDELAVAWTFNDADGDAQDFNATRATVQWYSDDTKVGTTGIATYTIASTDVGKSITVRLTPHTSAATSDPYFGTEILSQEVNTDEGNNGGLIVIPDGTRVTSVDITGTPTVAQQLTAVPSCGTECVGVTYQWQIESSAGSGTYNNITGETAITYTVKAVDQKKKIRVEAFNAVP